MSKLIEITQVNIPFTMLYESYLDMFLTNGLNPEIGLDCTALENFSFSQFSNIADRLHQRGLSITLHAPFIDLSPGSPDPAVRALTRHRFEQVLKLMPLFKPKTVVCHAAYDSKRYRVFRDQWIENSLQTWFWLSKRVRDEGGVLMLENVYEHGPDDILILFESLADQRVGFCFDTGHQAAFSRIALEKWIESLGPFLGQVHLHDNCGNQDEHLALGRGNIDFPMLFEHLKSIKKDPPVITLEPHRKGDFWPSIEYLAKVWPW